MNTSALRSGALLGRDQCRSKTLFWEYGRNTNSFAFPKGRDRSPNLALREANWKLLVNADGSGAQLYDLSVDGKETNNMATQKAEVTKRLVEKLLAWRGSVP